MEEKKDDTKCKLADQKDISYEMFRCDTNFPQIIIHASFHSGNLMFQRFKVFTEM